MLTPSMLAITRCLPRCIASLLLVHVLQQVYDGSKAFWSEEDACEPVNAYGRSKLEAEVAIRVRGTGIRATLGMGTRALCDRRPCLCELHPEFVLTWLALWVFRITGPSM